MPIHTTFNGLSQKEREKKSKVTFKKLIHEDISEDLHLRSEKDEEEIFFAALVKG
jgi:hypothetical protein